MSSTLREDKSTDTTNTTTVVRTQEPLTARSTVLDRSANAQPLTARSTVVDMSQSTQPLTARSTVVDHSNASVPLTARSTVVDFSVPRTQAAEVPVAKQDPDRFTKALYRMIARICPSLVRPIALEKGYSQVDWLKLTRTDPNLNGLNGAALRKNITREEVALHNTNEDGWMVLKGKVYNVAPYARFHPGGAAIMMRLAGKDGTAQFAKFHPWVNGEALMEKCLIGWLEKPPLVAGDAAPLPAAVAATATVVTPPVTSAVPPPPAFTTAPVVQTSPAAAPAAATPPMTAVQIPSSTAPASATMSAPPAPAATVVETAAVSSVCKPPPPVFSSPTANPLTSHPLQSTAEVDACVSLISMPSLFAPSPLVAPNQVSTSADHSAAGSSPSFSPITFSCSSAADTAPDSPTFGGFGGFATRPQAQALGVLDLTSGRSQGDCRTQLRTGISDPCPPGVLDMQ